MTTLFVRLKHVRRYLFGVRDLKSGQKFGIVFQLATCLAYFVDPRALKFPSNFSCALRVDGNSTSDGTDIWAST